MWFHESVLRHIPLSNGGQKETFTKAADTVGKSFELNDAATKGGENAHWNSRTSYSYPRVYP
jgi:hypothetical protein